MSLEEIVWSLPHPITESDVFIKADHINELRDAINNTRANIPSPGDLTPHSTSHGVNGSDPITDSIELSSDRYFNTGAAYIHSAGLESFFSNGAVYVSGAWVNTSGEDTLLMSLSNEEMSLMPFNSDGEAPEDSVFAVTKEGHVHANIVFSDDIYASNLHVGSLYVEEIEQLFQSGFSTPFLEVTESLMAASAGIETITSNNILAKQINTSQNILCDGNVNAGGDIFANSLEADLVHATHLWGSHLTINNAFSSTTNGMSDDGSVFQIWGARPMRLSSVRINLVGGPVTVGEGEDGQHTFSVNGNAKVTNSIDIGNGEITGDDSLHGFGIRGAKVFSDDPEFSDVVNLYDKVIIGDGYNYSRWRNEIASNSQSGHEKYRRSGAKLWIPFGEEASLSSDGYMQIGLTNNFNLIIDKDSLQARYKATRLIGSTLISEYSNRSVAPLNLNPYGGAVTVGSDTTDVAGVKPPTLSVNGFINAKSKTHNTETVEMGARIFHITEGENPEELGEKDIVEFKLTENDTFVLLDITLTADDNSSRKSTLLIRRDESEMHVKEMFVEEDIETNGALNIETDTDDTTGKVIITAIGNPTRHVVNINMSGDKTTDLVWKI